MSVVLLNLLAANSGGQLARADAFLSHFREHDKFSKLIVVKNKKNDINIKDDNVILVDVKTLDGALSPWYRLLWENVVLPFYVHKYKVDVYLTFSHYITKYVSMMTYSIVGVSNLAPFSEYAWKVERLLTKIKMSLLKRSIISSAKRADRVVALSVECSKILTNYGVDAGLISVIPNGVKAIENYVPQNGCVLKKYNINNKYILYISHFHRYKNFESVICAYNRLPNTIRQEYELVLIGSPVDMVYYNSMISLAKSTNAQGKITIVPGLPRENLNVFYSSTSLFVFSSLIENSPNILLEAMSWGLPMLVSDIDPMPEFAGDSAVYFNPFDCDDLSSKIVHTLSSDSELKSLRQKALLQSRKYSWDQFVKSVTNIYLKKV